MLNIRFNDDHTGEDAVRLAARRAGAARRNGSTSTSRSAASPSSPSPARRWIGRAPRSSARPASTPKLRHRRRHLRRPLHLALLPGGRVRPGRRQHAPGGRARARRGTARLARHLSRACCRPSWPSRHCGRRRVPPSVRAASVSCAASCGWRAAGRTASTSSPDTPQGFLASLAPLIAFPLVGDPAACWLGGDGTRRAHRSARHVVRPAGPTGAVVRAGAAMGARRRLAALRHGVQLVPVAAARAGRGAADRAGGMLLQRSACRSTPRRCCWSLLASAGYGLWLHWFLARHGLALPALAARRCWWWGSISAPSCWCSGRALVWRCVSGG